MASIVFTGTYQPITCGIADYTQYLTRVSPPGRWAVLSFDLRGYGVPYTCTDAELENVWYGIPSRTVYPASAIRNGVERDDSGAVTVTNLKTGQEVVAGRGLWLAWYALRPAATLYASERKRLVLDSGHPAPTTP